MTVWLGVLVMSAIALALGATNMRLLLFFATVLAEVAAMVIAFVGRARLGRDEPGRRVWTWIGVGFALRVIAELRLTTLYLAIVPAFIKSNEWLWAIYFLGLRYLYTLADLALLAALLTTRRALLSTGLDFHLRSRDALWLVLLPPLPLTVYLLQSVFVSATDPGLHTFRIISASVGALVSGVCVVLVSPALQMGGGAWAWIWGAAAIAGIARALAFAASAMTASFPILVMLEQGLLWTFACGWLLATTLHLRLISPRRGVLRGGRSR